MVQTLGKCGLRVIRANQTINCLAAKANGGPLTCLDENESKSIDWLLDLEKKIRRRPKSPFDRIKALWHLFSFGRFVKI